MITNDRNSHGRDVQNEHNEDEKKDFTGINQDVSGNDRTQEEKAERKIHDHGRTKYKSHSNHSSADNQPKTNTGPGTV